MSSKPKSICISSPGGTSYRSVISGWARSLMRHWRQYFWSILRLTETLSCSWIFLWTTGQCPLQERNQEWICSLYGSNLLRRRTAVGIGCPCRIYSKYLRTVFLERPVAFAMDFDPKCLSDSIRILWIASVWSISGLLLKWKPSLWFFPLDIFIFWLPMGSK